MENVPVSTNVPYHSNDRKKLSGSIRARLSSACWEKHEQETRQRQKDIKTYTSTKQAIAQVIHTEHNKLLQISLLVTILYYLHS